MECLVMVRWTEWYLKGKYFWGLCLCDQFCRMEMTSWAAKMHRRAATFGNVVTSCGHPSGPYPRRLEKVKFGVPLEEVCKNDIPGPLLVSFNITPKFLSLLIKYFLILIVNFNKLTVQFEICIVSQFWQMDSWLITKQRI